MHRHTQQTCGPQLIMPYAQHYAKVRRQRARKIRTGAPVFPARASTLAGCRINIGPKMFTFMMERIQGASVSVPLD